MNGGLAARGWVASFYQFQPINDTAALREELWQACVKRGLKGTVLIAPEGVNVALTGSRALLEDFVNTRFPSAPSVPGVAVNWTPVAADTPAFSRLKVRERPEIVTSGRALGAHTPVGRHVEPADWNGLLADPEVLVLDVRNRYESAIGTFPGATVAGTERFQEFAAFAGEELTRQRGRRVAMFCTGGIRCEKASAHLLASGFEDVRQLRGGILSYFASTNPADNAFAGECFVFDGRVSLRRDGTEGSYQLCQSCGQPTPKGPALMCVPCREGGWED